MNDKPNLNRPNWDAETSDPEMAKEIKKHLSEVIDPELGFNVVQLGLIRNVNIQEDDIVITMILTTPFCPYGPAMMESVRQKVEAATGKQTRVDFSMEPWDYSMMEEGLGADWGLF